MIDLAPSPGIAVGRDVDTQGQRTKRDAQAESLRFERSGPARSIGHDFKPVVLNFIPGRRLVCPTWRSPAAPHDGLSVHQPFRGADGCSAWLGGAAAIASCSLLPHGPACQDVPFISQLGRSRLLLTVGWPFREDPRRSRGVAKMACGTSRRRGSPVRRVGQIRLMTE